MSGPVESGVMAAGNKSNLVLRSPRMLKISLEGLTEEAATFRLEGQVTGPLVMEVRRVIGRFQRTSRQLTLDLAEVTFVDRDGLSLLCELMEGRVTIINCSPFLIEQLKAVGAVHECERRQPV